MLIAVEMSVLGVWVVTLCGLVHRSQRFEETHIIIR